MISLMEEAVTREIPAISVYLPGNLNIMKLLKEK
jgi:hypothetical protein